MEFVGYQIIDNNGTGSTTVTVDLSALDVGGPIAAGDIAFVGTVCFQGTPATHTWTASGWISKSSWARGTGTLSSVGQILERRLDGTETTVTFTDPAGGTVGAFVAVYRDVGPTGPVTTQTDPASAFATTAPQYNASATADVTCTLATEANVLGSADQLLLYVYADVHGGSPLVATPDAAFTERFSHEFGGIATWIGWYDEEWASAADLPSRAESAHWTSGGGSYHAGRLHRFYSPVIPVATGGDAWAWVG